MRSNSILIPLRTQIIESHYDVECISVASFISPKTIDVIEKYVIKIGYQIYRMTPF